MVLIKHIKKQTRKVKEKVGDKEIEKEVLLNYVISYVDHNGRLRHHTEDEMRRNLVNMNDALMEFDKKLPKGEAS